MTVSAIEGILESPETDWLKYKLAALVKLI